MLKPAIQVALLFRIIFAFEVFASVIAITGRGEDDARRARRCAGRATNSNPHVAAAYATADPRALARRGRHRGAGPCGRRRSEAAAMTRQRRLSDRPRAALRARDRDGALGDPARSTSSRLGAFSTQERSTLPERAAAAPPLDGHAELLPPLGRHHRRARRSIEVAVLTLVIVARDRHPRRLRARALRVPRRRRVPAHDREHARVPDRDPRDPARR